MLFAIFPGACLQWRCSGRCCCHIHALMWLFEHKSLVCWGQNIFKDALPHLSVLRWLDARFRIPVDRDLLLMAVEVVKHDRNREMVAQWLWLAAILNEWPQKILEEGISAAPLGLARWMWSSKLGPMELSLNPAAARGDMAFLAWGRALGGTIDEDTIDFAVSSGSIRVLEWMRQHTIASYEVAASGRVDLLEWCRFHGGRGCSSRAFILAASNGHLAVIRWLLIYYRDQYHPTSIAHTSGAGHLKIVSYLCSRFYPTIEALDWAAASGHLDILRWLHNNTNARCTTAAMDSAAANGHLEIVQWLHEHRTERCTFQAMNGTAGGGFLPTIVWLHENRLEGATTDAIDLAARGGHGPVVYWLSSHRHEGYTSAAVDGSIASGNIELFQWFLADGLQTCTHRGLDSAVLSGNTGMLQFLRRGRFGECSNFSFALAVGCGRVYVTRWLFANYPQEWNMIGIADNAAKIGWSDEIINMAFGKGVKFVEVTMNATT